MPRSILISLTTEQADRKLCPPVLRSFVHPLGPYRSDDFGSAVSFIAGADLFQQLLEHLQSIMRSEVLILDFIIILLAIFIIVQTDLCILRDHLGPPGHQPADLLQRFSDLMLL